MADFTGTRDPTHVPITRPDKSSVDPSRPKPSIYSLPASSTASSTSLSSFDPPTNTSSRAHSRDLTQADIFDHSPLEIANAESLSAPFASERAYDEDPTWVPDPSDPHCLRHAEFGFCDDQRYRRVSRFKGLEPASGVSTYDSRAHVKKQQAAAGGHKAGVVAKVGAVAKGKGKTGKGTDGYELIEMEDPSYLIYLTTYASYLLLIIIGHVNDFIEKRLYKERFKHLQAHNGYAALNTDFDSFYTRRLKARLDDCFSRPVTRVAGRTITLLDRTTSDHCHTFNFTGTTTQALNISSYNYLGFAQSRGGCADAVETVIRRYGVSTGGARADVGTLDIHVECESLIAAFLGVEDAMLISQGFATNSATLPALANKGCLIVSDELNHSSIRFGARLSGAMIRQYKHNDMRSLEALLREAISQGQPRTHRPWKKILIVVEGLYSMEGTMVNLPGVIRLKNKYKCYLYVDEAHSIGALGPRGRGVCDYFGVDSREVDILMGTLTKSFGAAGGYIAGTRESITALRASNHATIYAEAMTPPVVTQIVASLAGIMGPQSAEILPRLKTVLPERLLDGTEGRERLRRLAFNTRYLNHGLRKLGFIVPSHPDSPIIPLLIFLPGVLPLFGRLMLDRHKIAVVVVAYPATPLVSGRARFCVSAAHTKTDIDALLRACEDVGSILGLKYGSRETRWPLEKVIANAVELAETADADY